MTLSRQIVRQWMALRRENLPDHARQAAKRHCLDAVGVGLAASALEQGLPYRRFAANQNGRISTLTGTRLHQAADAAMVNGGLIHSLEFDDTHTGSIVHGSAVLASVALAIGQDMGSTRQQAMDAYLLGYELFIRIGLASQGSFQRKGFQITSIAGPMVAALVACDLLQASEDERVNAVGIALSQASGVFEFLTNGSSVKSLHPGWAAHGGIIAARLAVAGLTGPETSMEGERGLFSSYAGDGHAAERLAASMADFGAAWHMADVAYKLLPCCHYLHPFVEAADEIASGITDTDQIARIELRIAAGAAPIVCEPWALKCNPSDGHAIRWSLPIVVASRLVEGKVDLATFSRKASAKVLALAQRMSWAALEPNRFPQAFEAEVFCHLHDGRTLHSRIEDVRGNKSRPVDDSVVLTKFRTNAGMALAADAVTQLEAFFLDPADRPDFSAFANALNQRTSEEAGP